MNRIPTNDECNRMFAEEIKELRKKGKEGKQMTDKDIKNTKRVRDFFGEDITNNLYRLHAITEDEYTSFVFDLNENCIQFIEKLRALANQLERAYKNLRLLRVLSTTLDVADTADRFIDEIEEVYKILLPLTA